RGLAPNCMVRLAVEITENPGSRKEGNAKTRDSTANARRLHPTLRLLGSSVLGLAGEGLRREAWRPASALHPGSAGATVKRVSAKCGRCRAPPRRSPGGRY